MGLTTSHDFYSGGYGGFMDFRTRLAAKIGVSLLQMQGYTENGIPWSTINHGLVPLLYHSDCDGHLTVSESKKIVEGLNDVLNKLTPEDKKHPFFEKQIIQFRDGCLDAIKNKQKVIFG